MTIEEKKIYMKAWRLSHKKTCASCSNLIGNYRTRCKSCETRQRWRNGFNPPHPQNKGQFKKGIRSNKSTEFKAGLKPWNKGILWLEMRGKNHHNWQGGLTEKYWSLRMTTEYKDWRRSVLRRDNYKCIWCGNESKLEADHIKPFSKYPELRTDLSNGRTLCHDCHLKTDTFGGRALHG